MNVSRIQGRTRLGRFQEVPWDWGRALWLSSDVEGLWLSCPSVWHPYSPSRGEKIRVCQAVLTLQPLFWPQM